MSRAHAESVIKNIIRKIVQQCAERGHAVSDTLAAFMVKSVVLDPRQGFDADRTLTRQDIQKLEEVCLDRLMVKCSPSLDTIKMQVYFDLNYTSRREFLEEIHRVMESRLSTVSREITDSRVKTRDELDALYRKIITYILLRSGMGSPAAVNAVKEATATLQSVFPQTELGAFMVLIKKDKEQQLRELTMIVTGIRLFNKASKRREEETHLSELMPPALNEALPVVSKTIEEELSVSQSLAWKYTAVLEKITRTDDQPEDSVILKQALYNVRQHEAFLKVLLDDARLCAQRVESLQLKLSSQMKLVRETVRSKTAVPTAHVFPLFKSLSELWSGLQDEAELLSILSNIRLSLQLFLASQAKMFSEAYLDSLLQDTQVKTDEQRMTESADESIVPAEMKTREWLLPDSTASFNHLLLQYNGVCGYTLVRRDGLLLPGNPHIGVLKHKEKLYVFSSKTAALEFASCPDDFITKVAEKAKLCPELIQLLKLHQQFSCVSPYSEMQPGESLLVKPIIRRESSTQTDIHPVETNIVKSYEWNEWELRRKATKLADLLTKATHSAQTDLSHMRRENVTQTWLPKEAACQSRRDGPIVGQFTVTCKTLASKGQLQSLAELLVELKHRVGCCIDEAKAKLHSLSRDIWSHPELAYEEREAHDRLVEFFSQEEGWKVDSHFTLDTAFRATWRSGGSEQGDMVKVGLLCEYDALPGIGHACGHNLIAEVGAAAALGLKAVLEKVQNSPIQVQVTVLGTPAEEDGGGKIDMLREGAFDGLDVALMAHPSKENATYLPCVAEHDVTVKYHGKASHASAYPWEGINALDAAVLCYNNLSLLRQQMKPDWRVHGIIKHGGVKPNIIPAYTELEYYLRTPSRAELPVLEAKAERCFRSAAVATGCEVQVEFARNKFDNMLRNATLEELYERNGKALGMDFTIDEDVLQNESGSTDFGNVTFVVPGIHPYFYIGSNALNHTEEYAAAAGGDEAQYFTLRTAKALAMTMLDVLLRPDLLQRVKQEFMEAKLKEDSMATGKHTGS